MSVCTLSNSKFNFSFRIDPTEVKWKYHLEISQELTIGGMVKYIKGIVIDDVEVTVETGIGGIEEVKRIGDFVYAHMTHARNTGETLRFLNPDFPWDLQVYIIDIGGLRVDGVTKNYKLNLRMSVIKNNMEMDVYEVSSLVGGYVEGITNLAMIHKVTSGDTLESIAAKYYGDVELGKKLLLEVNTNRSKIDGDYIQPGAEIVVPYLTYDTGYSVYVRQPPPGDPQNVLRDPNADLGANTQTTAPVTREEEKSVEQQIIDYSTNG